MKKALLIKALMGLMALSFISIELQAAVPNLINYQGMLIDSVGTPIQGNKLVKYTIYDKSNSEIWNSGFINTAFTDGLFTAQLGASPQPVLPANMCSDDSSLTLGVTVDVNPEFSPRTRLVTAAYAFEALHADSVDWSDVSSIPADIADGDNGGIIYSAGSGLDLTGSIFSVEPDGITASHIAQDGVGSSEIADNNVTSNDITNNTILDTDINTSADIAPTKINGTAATLSATQTLTGTNTFFSSLIIGDSTFRANNTGISIGSTAVPTGLRMVSIERDYNTTGLRYGTYVDFSNSGTGTLYGGYSNLLSTGSGPAYGFYGNVASDNAFRCGVYGRADANTIGLTTGQSYGVFAMGLDALESYGVYGVSQGTSNTYGVAGVAVSGVNRYGIYGVATGGTVSYAGYFSGNVHVVNTLTKGAGAFKIDHPLDPENKFLQHSFVESPDMMNIYNGNVMADSKGEAVVALPEWFTALNMEYRYQLTSIGAPGPNLYIKVEVTNNKFVIAGAQPNSKVSWQVTGIRNDKFAQANRIQVEVEKKPDEKGKYAHPEAFGLSAERGIDFEKNSHKTEVPNNLEAE